MLKAKTIAILKWMEIPGVAGSTRQGHPLAWRRASIAATNPSLRTPLISAAR
jgi:hypothetical protein